ncbi:MAG TPA: 16S rRNA (cytosine(967)-C(5))-methyltransferase RsmB [Chitinivibrionales bacterium]|nr:16S rRNA (cytosine(967)-C(5))-methyltransferase RsmB [Chitinivibrionales bacterium]
MNSRGIALRILQAWDKRPGILDNAIDRELSQSSLDHRDRRFVFELVNGVVRRRLTLDHVLGQFVQDPAVLQNQYIMRILEIGAYQILYMDRVPDHASVNESVNLTRLARRTMHSAGLVNATLRAMIKDRKRIKLPDPQKDLGQRLSVEFSHPKWMVLRWLSRLGLTKTKLLLSFNNERPDIFLRRKLHGLSRPQFETESKEFCDSAGGYLNLYYKLNRQVMPETLPLFKEGACTVQAPSSGWVVALLDITQNDRMLDVCSAPGGKSALAAELTGGSGAVVACELRKNRMNAAIETVRRLRLANVLPCLCDGVSLPFKSGAFSKVLLDAPCSGTGVLHRHPEGRWIKGESDIPRLAALQRKLLDASAAIVAKGGAMVYSTCSLEPEENEQVVEGFLKDHAEFALEKPPAAIPETFVDMKGYLRITPWEHRMDGMFGARLKKL